MSGPASKDDMPSSDDSDIWLDWISTQSISARNRLIQRYMPWVRRVAAAQYSIYRSNLLEFDDYVHYGILGLFQSIERYVPEKGYRFETFAYPRIRGAIVEGVEERGINTRVSEEQILSIVGAETLEGDEIDFSNLVNIIVEIALIKLLDLNYTTSLHSAHNPLDIYSQYRQNIMIDDLVNQLDESKRLIIESRYRRYMTFSEIAQILDISKGRVSQLHAIAIQDLRVFYQKRY